MDKSFFFKEGTYFLDKDWLVADNRLKNTGIRFLSLTCHKELTVLLQFSYIKHRYTLLENQLR